MGNGPLNFIDILGLYYIYEHQDENGDTYYVIADQSKFDAIINAITGVNPQVAGHILFIGGEVVGGTSWNTPDTKTQIETLYAAEIEQFKQSLMAVPYGSYVVAGYEVLATGKTLLIDIPKNLSVAKRDDVILKVMGDANISKKSYSENFISAAAAADQFVQDYNWMFQKESILANKTQYDVGKAMALDANSNVATKARDKIYVAIYNAAYDKLLSDAKGLSPSFYADYRNRNGRNYPSQVVPNVSWSDIGMAESMLPVSTHDVAAYVADKMTADIETVLISNYDAVIKYFNSLFCEDG